MAWPGNMSPQTTRLVRTDTLCTDEVACVVARADLASPSGIAAKTALKRKKQHEHSLEQTQAQIGTLEQQINAIESANINKETLLAMEKASDAMKQIHGKLTPEKVDETMYATPTHLYCSLVCLESLSNHYCHPGTSYESKTHSAKRSSTLSQATKSENPSTRRTWRQSWTSYSRRSWTSRCSRLGQCQCRIRSSECLPHLKTVSFKSRATSRLLHMLTSLNSQGQDAGRGAGRRRRGRAAEAASRNGHVRSLECMEKHIECQQDTTRISPRALGMVAHVDQEVVPSRWARSAGAGSPSAIGVGVTGGCICDCEGTKEKESRQPAIQFPNQIEWSAARLSPA